MWSEAYDNFQIIYIEAHPTKGTFAINTWTSNISKSHYRHSETSWRLCTLRMPPTVDNLLLGVILTVHLSLCPRHNCTRKHVARTIWNYDIHVMCYLLIAQISWIYFRSYWYIYVINKAHIAPNIFIGNAINMAIGYWWLQWTRY